MNFCNFSANKIWTSNSWSWICEDQSYCRTWRGNRSSEIKGRKWTFASLIRWTKRQLSEFIFLWIIVVLKKITNFKNDKWQIYSTNLYNIIMAQIYNYSSYWWSRCQCTYWISSGHINLWIRQVNLIWQYITI